MEDGRCWFCHDDVRGDPPPGGWLIDDGVWRAGHAPASYAVPGTVILETRRHVLDQSGFDARERATVANATGRLVSAVRAATACDRVYQWATMDGFPHFHTWLVPWWAGSGLRGPRYLTAAIVDVQAADPDLVLTAAHRIAAELAAAATPPAAGAS
jgi:diadenosine tetraphosphate (Ap4A) HIT family hydrolase